MEQELDDLLAHLDFPSELRSPMGEGVALEETGQVPEVGILV